MNDNKINDNELAYKWWRKLSFQERKDIWTNSTHSHWTLSMFCASTVAIRTAWINLGLREQPPSDMDYGNNMDITIKPEYPA